MVDLHKNEIPEGIYNPFNNGWNERIDGKRQDDNPFAINNWKHYDWEDGWLTANKTIDVENR